MWCSKTKGNCKSQNCSMLGTCAMDRAPGAASNPPNPKQRFGDMKVPLALFPSSALIHGAQAFADGAAKYGPYNWRDKAVEAMTYIHAAERHLRAWLDREEDAPDSGNHHLGHVLACVAIILDAQEQGNLIDNRPIVGTAAKVLARFERAREYDDEVLTTTFSPIEEPTCADDCVHPSHRLGRLGRREDAINGADTLGLNKPPCYCPPDSCMCDKGHTPRYVYCKRAEDADRIADPYSSIHG